MYVQLLLYWQFTMYSTAGLFYVWPNLCSSLPEFLSAPHSSTILCMWEGTVGFLIAILLDEDSNKD